MVSEERYERRLSHWPLAGSEEFGVLSWLAASQRSAIAKVTMRLFRLWQLRPR
jgi:hypothetical protein